MASDTTQQHTYKDSIEQYLAQPTPQSCTTAVAALTDPINRTHKSSGAGACESQLWDLWTTFLEVACTKTISSDATSSHLDYSAHDTLANLVAAIGASDAPERPDNSEPAWFGTLWKGLPLLGPSMREFWNKMPVVNSRNALSWSEWTALNAFAARLLSSNAFDTSLFGVWELRAQLEEEVADEHLADSALSALVWLNGAQDRIASLSKEGKSFGGKTDPSKVGALAESAGVQSPGFNDARRQFWLKRLHERSEALAGRSESIAKLCAEVASTSDA